MVNKNTIDNLITGSVWHIDFDFGMSALNKYLHDLELLSTKQVTLKDLYPVTKESDYKYKRSGQTAIITLNGVMRVHDGLCSKGISEQVQAIEHANNDVSIKNILLHVNSGGGESQAGTILHNAIKDSAKPVYVLGEMIASAAYNASLSAKKIFLSSTMSTAGSIGTMITLDKVSLENYKANYTELYSNVSTDKNRSWRALLNGDSTDLTNEITKNAIKFGEKVKEFRKVDDSVLTGDMYYAEEAVQNGLIDGIKTLKEVLQIINQGSETLINQNNSNMNFTEKFNSILNKINTFFGWNATSEAEVSDSLDAIGETFDAFKSNLTAQVTAQATETFSAQLEETNRIIVELNERINLLDTSILEMTANVNNLTAENQRLEESNRSLNSTIMDLKGRQPLTTNSDAPEYKAEKNFIDAFGNVSIKTSSN